MDAIWSSVFARQVAYALGYGVSASSGKPAAIPYGPAEERIVNKVTEAFRYLPPDKIQTALDYSAFLGKETIAGGRAPPANRGSCAAEKLSEVRDLVCFLKARYGTAEPADEKDYWTEEDRREMQQETRARLEDSRPILVEVRFPGCVPAPDSHLIGDDDQFDKLLEQLGPGAELHVHSVRDLRDLKGGICLRK